MFYTLMSHVLHTDVTCSFDVTCSYTFIQPIYGNITASRESEDKCALGKENELAIIYKELTNIYEEVNNDTA